MKDKSEYEFKPDIIVSDITQIYPSLSDSDIFCKAVAGDGRSYSPELFLRAIHVLQKIGKSPTHISDFQMLHDKISVSRLQWKGTSESTRCAFFFTLASALVPELNLLL